MLRKTMAPMVMLSCIAALAPAQSLEPGASDRWTILDGKPDIDPDGVCLLFEHARRYFLVDGDSLQEYFPKTHTWGAEVLKLPQRIGTGASATSDGKRTIFLLAGGGSQHLWRIDVDQKTVEPMTQVPHKPGVGIGGSITYDRQRDQIYVMPGNLTRLFLRTDLSGRWTQLTRVGDKTGLAAIGATTGHLMWLGNTVLAWPDHHVQAYEIDTGTWQPRVWISYGVRPHTNGGMFAEDTETGERYILMGLRSRTLTYFEPQKRVFHYLRPRLPLRMEGEGNRAIVAPIEGRKHLLIYAKQSKNRMLRIPLDQLEKITPTDPASDVDSPWITVHERAGSSLVRTPAHTTSLPGLMGVAGDQWYFARLANMRFVNPSQLKWTKYPGSPLGTSLQQGLCAAWDGDRAVYVLTGESKNFRRVLVPNDDEEPPASERLPPPPFVPRVGAQAAWWYGRFYVLAGGESRAVTYFSPSTNRWVEESPLPEEATPVGENGSAILGMGKQLLAISGQGVWSYSNLYGWNHVTDLPFRLAVKGGMIAGRSDAGKVYLIEGGESRRAACLDLETKSVTELPWLPDVVSVAGNRALIYETPIGSALCLHRGHDTHEIVMLPVAGPEKKPEDGPNKK